MDKFVVRTPLPQRPKDRGTRKKNMRQSTILELKKVSTMSELGKLAMRLQQLVKQLKAHSKILNVDNDQPTGKRRKKEGQTSEPASAETTSHEHASTTGNGGEDQGRLSGDEHFEDDTVRAVTHCLRDLQELTTSKTIPGKPHPVTAEALKRTKLGKTVRKLSTRPETQVASLAKELVQQWTEILTADEQRRAEQKRQLDADESPVDRAKARRQLLAAFHPTTDPSREQQLVKEMEQAVFAAVFETHVASSDEQGQAEELSENVDSTDKHTAHSTQAYRQRLRRLVVNLKLSPHVRDKLLNGSINGQDVAVMDATQLQSLFDE